MLTTFSYVLTLFIPSLLTRLYFCFNKNTDWYMRLWRIHQPPIIIHRRCITFYIYVYIKSGGEDGKRQVLRDLLLFVGPFFNRSRSPSEQLSSLLNPTRSDYFPEWVHYTGIFFIPVSGHPTQTAPRTLWHQQWVLDPPSYPPLYPSGYRQIDYS